MLCLQHERQAFLKSCQKKPGSSRTILMTTAWHAHSAGPSSSPDSAMAATPANTSSRYCADSAVNTAAATVGMAQTNSIIPVFHSVPKSRANISK